MIKILPILIIPLFFLIVYSGVKNLTQNKLNNVVKKTEIKENSNNNYDLTSKAKSIKTMKSEQLASNEPDKKNVVEEKNSDTATIEKDKESKKAEETVKKNPKQEKNVLKMTTLKKNKIVLYTSSKKQDSHYFKDFNHNQHVLRKNLLFFYIILYRLFELIN